MSDGYGKAPKAVADLVSNGKVSVGAFGAYCMMTLAINPKDSRPGVWMGTSTLASQLGGVSETTVRKYRQELIDAGALTVETKDQWLMRWRRENVRDKTVYGFPLHPKPARTVKDDKGRPSTRKRDVEAKEQSEQRMKTRRQEAETAIRIWMETGAVPMRGSEHVTHFKVQHPSPTNADLDTWLDRRFGRSA